LGVAESLRIIEALGRFVARAYGHCAHQQGTRERSTTDFVDPDDHLTPTDQFAFKLEQISGVYRHHAKITDPQDRLTFATMSTAVVVPLKRFDRAKSRLRHHRDLDVTAIVEELARGVITSARPLPVVIVSEDEELAAFAASLQVELMLSSSTTLNEALQTAYRSLSDRYDRLIIAHGDLLFPDGLGSVEPEPGITLFADHHGEGTNVMVIPANLDFHFAYGPGSLRRHLGEAQRLGVAHRVELTSPWRFDVDEPDDLANQ
jgi:2-phospho-L-lactate guanylyltransferase